MTIESKTSSEDHTIVRQLKRQLKLKLRHCIDFTVVVTGSSRRVEDGVDKLVSCPTSLL
jgi:hypothetical protein